MPVLTFECYVSGPFPRTDFMTDQHLSLSVWCLFCPLFPSALSVHIEALCVGLKKFAGNLLRGQYIYTRRQTSHCLEEQLSLSSMGVFSSRREPLGFSVIFFPVACHDKKRVTTRVLCNSPQSAMWVSSFVREPLGDSCTCHHQMGYFAMKGFISTTLHGKKLEKKEQE